MTSFSSRYGNPAVDYDGAHIRPHFRHGATVVSVSGRIDASNVDRVSDHARRFVMADKPFVLDLSGVTSFAPQAFRLLSAVDDKCLTVGVEWAMVAGDAVTRQLRARSDEALFPVVGSVAEAVVESDALRELGDAAQVGHANADLTRSKVSVSLTELGQMLAQV